MKKIMYYTFLLLFLPFIGFTQSELGILKGKVTEESEEGQIFPLIGANVYWLGTTIGTVTDIDGGFEIEKDEQNYLLVVSYTGFRTDTIDVSELNFVNARLEATIVLDGVVVTHRRKATEISMLNPMKVERIGEKELLKAACCNLSESFETSPSIDVSFTDAVTGTRQIQMLGLAGPYSQITRENLPNIRGLSAIYGLTFIPGTWVESIQLNKGAGSVANGFESIAGQINVELRKPESAEKLYLNVYGNEGGRMEANVNFAHKFNEGTWATGLLLHAKNSTSKHDRNSDGFLDKPLSKQFIGLNRWKYIGDDGIVAQLGVKGTYIDNAGGQMDFEPEQDALTTNNWGMKMEIKRLDAWAKLGKVYVEMPWKSFGSQISVSLHDQNSYFGLTSYDAKHNTFYANLMYQSILSNTFHKFRVGTSFQYDDFTETLNDSVFLRTETVPGAFFEYTYCQDEKFSFVGGIRGDYHNNYGFFVTPRMHMRYGFNDNAVLRASIGRGLRTASIISENIGLLASSRDLEILGTNADSPYGLDNEIAWNYGLNFTQKFTLDYREGSISFDFYRTDFENQIVVDLDQTARKAIFYNLDGDSYSNSFQAQFDYELVKNLDLRIAYRMYDVKTTYSGELLTKPLVASHRAFMNFGYSTRNHWNFDYTINWQGQKRIPFTGDNPLAYQLEENSPDFFLMNAQISKNWNETFEIYIGVENLLDYTQSDPIISANDPFSENFESSLIWGPVFGRNIYAGLRYRIK